MTYCKMVNPQGYQDCPYFCDSCATAERAAARAAEAERAAAEAAGAATCAACGGACGANSEDWWMPGGSMFFFWGEISHLYIYIDGFC